MDKELLMKMRKKKFRRASKNENYLVAVGY
jgi:hypothetical protein